MIWHLLAPGPSASVALAQSLPSPLGVVGNAWELAPWADFLASTDSAWWRKYPQAHEFAGRKFAVHIITGIEKVRIPVVNSGVLAMEVARRLGATEIRLHGYDMHGTHFFGPYKNGLKNATDEKRRQHLKEFAAWGKRYHFIRVVNCTPGSLLTCFEYENVLRQEGEPGPGRAQSIHSAATGAQGAGLL